jgi:hypothetical protein
MQKQIQDVNPNKISLKGVLPFVSKLPCFLCMLGMAGFAGNGFIIILIFFFLFNI